MLKNLISGFAKRWQNHGYKVACITLLLLLLGNMGLYNTIGITMDYAKWIIDIIFFICTGAGLYSDPTTTNKWFKDDK